MIESRNKPNISFWIDGSLFRSPLAVPRSIFGDIDRVVTPNLSNHYKGMICAQRWLDVCTDPDYGHGELVRFIDEGFPRLFNWQKLNEEDGPSVSLFSLGPGDGAVDQCLLKHLYDQKVISSYWGVDNSFELLRVAVNRIAAVKNVGNPIQINAICGEFSGLNDRNYDQSGMDDPRLFCLTGFTLGNYPEANLLSCIRALMKPSDLLLLDARIHELGPMNEQSTKALPMPADVLSSYSAPSVKRFVFGPVEVATQAKIEDVDIRLETTRSLTLVPNALNIVIYCEDFKSVMRFSGRTVEKKRLDLAITTLYHYDELKCWLTESGFDLIGSEKQSGMALFLLRTKAKDDG